MPTNNFRTPEGDLENQTYITESWLIDQWIGDELRVWGNNSNGQLGINNVLDRCTPVTTFTGGTNWKQVSAGQNITAAIKTDGTLWVWGENLTGQLANNIISSTPGGLARSTPVTTFFGGTNWKQVSCGAAHMASIKTDGVLWLWGNNDSGRLGINDNRIGTYKSTPVTTFAGGNNWKQVSCGSEHTAAIKTDGSLWIWGSNTYTRLGLNLNDFIDRSTPVTTFAGGNNWKQVSTGDRHTAAIKTDGSLWVWGSNSYGRLGTNDSIQRSIPVTTFAGGNDWKQVSCGYDYTVAIKTNGTLWGWGKNYYIELGINASGNRLTPVTTFAGGNNWKQVSAGSNFVAATKTDGTLWLWGRSNAGQLGINNSTDLTRSTPVTTFLGGNNWKQVACGLIHTIAVTSGPDY